MIIRPSEIQTVLNRIAGDLRSSGRNEDAATMDRACYLVSESPEQLSETSKLTAGRLIDFIIDSNLLTADSPGVIVWSASSEEQIEAFIREMV